MNKIILMRGIQASGKTTWSRNWVREDPEHRIRFNNDDIRNMFGVYWVPSRESIGFIRDMQSIFMYDAMANHYDIVIDNMNLNSKELEYYTNLVLGYNALHGEEYTIEFVNCLTPLEECIKRDSLRKKPIGEKVIRNTYKKYKKLLSKLKENERCNGNPNEGEL